MLTDSIPPASASSMAASRTRSRLSGRRRPASKSYREPLDAIRSQRCNVVLPGRGNWFFLTLRSTSASARGDDDLGLRMPGRQVAEGLGRLIEWKRAVDAGHQLSFIDELGQGCEVLRVELSDEEGDPSLDEPSDHHGPSDLTERAKHVLAMPVLMSSSGEHERAVGRQHPPKISKGAVPDHVKHQVVSLPTLCEVLSGVVEYPIGAERAHQFAISGAAHGGHLTAERLGDLNREGADTPGSAVDENPTAGLEPALVAQPLERRQAGDGYGRRLFEREPSGFAGQYLGGREAGQGAARSSEHLVSDAEAGCRAADPDDDPCDVRFRGGVGRFLEAAEGSRHQRSTQHMEVSGIDRCGAHFHQKSIRFQIRKRNVDRLPGSAPISLEGHGAHGGRQLLGGAIVVPGRRLCRGDVHHCVSLLIIPGSAYKVSIHRKLDSLWPLRATVMRITSTGSGHEAVRGYPSREVLRTDALAGLGSVGIGN